MGAHLDRGFVRTPAEVGKLERAGALVRLEGNDDYEVADDSIDVRGWEVSAADGMDGDDGSVFGDSVNLASRLEGQSKEYGFPIIVGSRTALAVKDTAKATGAVVGLARSRRRRDSRRDLPS